MSGQIQPQESDMRDETRTKAQLIAETGQLRERLAELQATETQRKQAEEELRSALEAELAAERDRFPFN